MSNTWKELDAEQKKGALDIWRKAGRPAIPLRPGETCRNLEKFLSHPITRDSDAEAIKTWMKEAEMPTDKGHCPHGEFILTEGCPQCIAERQAKEAAKAEETVDRDTESLAENQQGQLELAASKKAGNATTGRLPFWVETDGATAGELQLNNQPTPVSEPHQPYRQANGSIVPGVTTVLKVLDKGEGLPYWSWDLGRQGIDYREVRDAAARVGTIAHHLIACHLKGEKVNVPRTDETAKAEKCFAKYLAWEKKNPLTPVMIEEPLVSELFKYGGTPDLLADINGKFVLIDFKTGSRIYDSYYLQVAAYRKLLDELGWGVAGARILRISPDDSKYEVGIQLDFDRDWEIFQHALAIYRLQPKETY